MIFRDRVDAGQQLAEALADLRAEHPIVIGIARGGMPVAAEVARRLEAPLDVQVVRKIGVPGNREYAIGALSGDVLRLDHRTIELLRIPRSLVDQTVASELQTLREREAIYHASHSPIEVRGRTVILVDDGLATGMSAQAAIAALRARGAGRVIFAAPVCAPDSAATLRQQADDVVCALSPPEFHAVGLWYDDFSPTRDTEVLRVLDEAAARQPEPTASART